MRGWRRYASGPQVRASCSPAPSRSRSRGFVPRIAPMRQTETRRAPLGERTRSSPRCNGTGRCRLSESEQSPSAPIEAHGLELQRGCRRPFRGPFEGLVERCSLQIIGGPQQVRTADLRRADADTIVLVDTSRCHEVPSGAWRGPGVSASDDTGCQVALGSLARRLPTSRTRSEPGPRDERLTRGNAAARRSACQGRSVAAWPRRDRIHPGRARSRNAVLAGVGG